jgi:RNA polymerase sigma-70 factor (ECF subfamily)
MEDVEQKTLIALQRSVASFQGRSKFLTWLHSVAANTALAHQRAIGRRRDQPVASDVPEVESATISSVVARRADITAAARALPLEQRQALALWEAGYSYDDIAERLGVAVGTVRSRISRGRDRIRELTAVEDPGRSRA